MECLQTNIDHNKLSENVDKNLKQNEMVNIAENIRQENVNDSNLNEHNNDNLHNVENEQQDCGNEQQNGGNEQQNSGNEQQNGRNEQQNGGNEQQNDGNEQQNCGNEQQNGRNELKNSGNEQQNDEINVDAYDETRDTPPVEVKMEEDDEFDSYSDGSHVFKKYRFRQRDKRPEYTQAEIPHYPIKSRRRYEHQDSFGCDQCTKTFNSRTGLLNHIRKHIAHKKIKYTCAICSKQFDNNNELIEHKIVHNDMIFTCEKCQLAFTDHCEFLEHEVTHTLRSFYKCVECGKYFNKSSILAHYGFHFDRRIECEICHSMIKKGNMRPHLTNHNLVKCVECDRLMRPDRMSYHMISHTGVKPFQCLYCGRGFANSQQRKTHTRTHTNERPFECEICHQKFKQRTDINKHKLTHFDKKYKCDICNKKFIHKESLTSHLTVHSNTQRYKCEICNKAVSTPTGYRKHMIYKHSNEKVFQCFICNLKYKTKEDLTKHSKTLKHKRSACKKQFRDEIED